MFNLKDALQKNIEELNHQGTIINQTCQKKGYRWLQVLNRGGGLLLGLSQRFIFRFYGRFNISRCGRFHGLIYYLCQISWTKILFVPDFMD